MSSLAAMLKTPGALVECDDDPEAVYEFLCSKGWSDGLPVIPPTPERVERMLAYCDRPWNEPIAKIPPRWGEATPLRLAANAVMAGCKPEYFPLFMLAIEAMCEEKFNLYGIQATTHMVAPLVIVNGPIVKELGINGGHNAFGPGVHSNATIGRAIRLALVNIGGAIPKTGDMSTFGSPAKYSYLVAENEDESPWEPLHVERGFGDQPADATVALARGVVAYPTQTVVRNAGRASTTSRNLGRRIIGNLHIELAGVALNNLSNLSHGVKFKVFMHLKSVPHGA